MPSSLKNISLPYNIATLDQDHSNKLIKFSALRPP